MKIRSYVLLFFFCFLYTLHLCNSEKIKDDNPQDGILKRIKEKILNAGNEADVVSKGKNFLQGKAKKDEKRVSKDKPTDQSRLGFVHSFVASLSVIIVSELGDKTFFIAAIMAMRHSRVTIFAGAMGALASMTVLSAVLGYATTVIPRKITYYVSSLLFALFGLKMLKEGYSMSPDEGMEEYEEVQADLRKRDEAYHVSNSKQDVETGIIVGSKRRFFLFSLVSKVFLEAFTLTFLAEWGDRSQITTIILAAREDVIGVIIGGSLGHAFCTGLAVLGGRMIAQKISVRTVTLIGGVVFLIFAVSAFFVSPASNS